MGAAGVAVPTTSVIGTPVAASLLPPTVTAVGSVLGAAMLLVTTQNVTMSTPTEFLLLKNMFHQALETNPDFDLDIRDDVQDECSNFGAVKSISIDKNTVGFVYLQFDSVTAAAKAQQALHGRWVVGKMITATFMSAQEYSTKFKLVSIYAGKSWPDRTVCLECLQVLYCWTVD